MRVGQRDSRANRLGLGRTLLRGSEDLGQERVDLLRQRVLSGLAERRPSRDDEEDDGVRDDDGKRRRYRHAEHDA